VARLLALLLLLSSARALELYADELVFRKNQLEARGRVELVKGRYAVKADWVKYLKDTEELFARGSVYLKDAKTGLEVTGSYLYLDLKTNEGFLINVRGRIERLNFEAKKVERLGEKEFLVYDGVLTTCPLERKELYVCVWRGLVKEGRALLVGNTLRFFRVPLFFLPFYSVPLSGRRSGLLFPVIGSTTYSPFIYRQPIFVALAPYADLTLTPDYRRDFSRGLSFEFRRLFTETDRLLFNASFFQEEPLKGEWWEGRGLHRRRRFVLSGELRLGRFSSALELLSDPYVYEDFFFESRLRTKPYALTHLTYARDLGRLTFYATARRYRDLTNDSNASTYQLLPELGLLLSPVRLGPFELYGDAFFTNFYSDRDGSTPRLALTPVLARHFRLGPVNQFSRLELISRFYPATGQSVGTWRFTHAVPQYAFVSYRGFKDYNLFELKYAFSPDTYELPAFDPQDAVNQENLITLSWVKELFKGERSYLKAFLRTGYNFLSSYTFPTDGKVINKPLMPLYFTVKLYPLERLSLWQDGIYDFNVGTLARSVTGASLSLGTWSFSVTNAQFRDSSKNKTADQLTGSLGFNGERFTLSLSVRYDRLEQKELYRSAYLGFKGGCWSLGLDYKRRYFAARDEYATELYLKFNLFFVEELQLPITRY